MGIGDTLRMGDLIVPERVTLLDDPGIVVATVTAPTNEIEPEPVEGERASRAKRVPRAKVRTALRRVAQKRPPSPKLPQ